MLNIVFLNDSAHVYNGSFSRVGDNRVSLSGVPAIAGGFTATRVGKNDNWNYSDYSTIYRVTDTTVEFSNDNSVYVEPEKPSKEVKGKIVFSDNNNEDGIRPESIVVKFGEQQATVLAEDPTFDFGSVDMTTEIELEVEGVPADYQVNISGTTIVLSYTPLSIVIEEKVAELNTVQQNTINSGTVVTLSDGTIEHFTLTANDQASLEGLAFLVAQGQELIPWHTSDQNEHCKFYSNTDMGIITSAATAFVTYHVTYFRDLRIYVRSLKTKAEVENVTYGMEIPEEYQSDVLKTLISSQKSTSI